MLTFAQLLNTSYKTINIVNGRKKSIENKEHATIIKSIHVIFFISENDVEVRFINSSPRVNRNIVAADFFLQPQAIPSLECRVDNISSLDCESALVRQWNYIISS